MSIAATLAERSNGQCELCSSQLDLSVFEVPPVNEAHSDKCVYLCAICKSQIEGEEALQANHWHCLNDSMWSQTPAVQVVAFRLLSQLAADHGWAQDALDMLYLEDDTRTWAEQALAEDSNGVRLSAGDTVVLIKDLDVKGSSLVAKRGTAVRNIGLTSNPEHIEGRVDGQRIVILTKFVKK